MSSISCVSGGCSGAGGLASTASAISNANAAFDDKAAVLVKAAQAAPEADSGSLAAAAVAVSEQKIVNQLLYATFKAQAEQQTSMVRDLTGST